MAKGEDESKVADGGGGGQFICAIVDSAAQLFFKDRFSGVAASLSVLSS